MTNTIIEKQITNVISNPLIDLCLSDSKIKLWTNVNANAYITKQYLDTLIEARKQYTENPLTDFKFRNSTKIDQSEFSCCAFVTTDFTKKDHFTIHVDKNLPFKFYQDYSDMLNDLNMGYIYLNEDSETKSSVKFNVDLSVINAETSELIEFKDELKRMRLLGVQMVRLLFNPSYYNVGEILLYNYNKYKEILTPSELILTALLPLAKITNYQVFAYNNTYSPILFRSTNVTESTKNIIKTSANIGFLGKLHDNFKNSTDTTHLYNSTFTNINSMFHNMDSQNTIFGNNFKAFLFDALAIITNNFIDPVKSMELIYKYDEITTENSDLKTKEQMMNELIKLLKENNYTQILNTFLK